MKLNRLPVLLIALSLVLLPQVHGDEQDVIHLIGGGTLKGEIRKETQEKVVIRTLYGSEHTVYRDQIQQVINSFNPVAEYKRRLALINPSSAQSAEQYYKLGLFCRRFPQLKSVAVELFRKSVDINPRHEKARQALGHVLYQGKWVTKGDCEKLEAGMIKVAGKWVGKAEYERAKAEEKKRRQEQLKKWMEWKKKQEAYRKKLAEWRKKHASKTYHKFKEIFKDNKADVNWENAHVHESKYYKIRSNTKKKYIHIYAKMLDKFYERFAKVFRYRRLPSKKSQVWIHANHAQFIQETRKPKTVGGFYNLKSRRVTAYHGTFGYTGNTLTVLAHECTHQFQHLILNTGSFTRTPIWVIEGLAVFFESAEYDGKKVIIGTIPADRLRTLKRMINKGNYIRIRDLIRTPHRRFTGIHYAHAWGIIYWMVYTNRRNRAVFNRIWEKCKDGGMNVKEFQDIIKVDIEEWEKVWVDWVKELQYDKKPN